MTQVADPALGGADVAWTPGTPVGSDPTCTAREGTGLANGDLSKCDTVTLTAGQRSRILIYTGTPVVCIDGGGSVPFPDDVELRDFECVVKLATDGGEATIDGAWFYNNGTLSATELTHPDAPVFPGDPASAVLCGQRKCPVFIGLGGETPTIADVKAGLCGIAFRVTSAAGATIGVDCAQLLFRTADGVVAIVLRSNASSAAPVPWGFHIHAEASKIASYDWEDLTCVFELTSWPEGFNPGTATLPLEGLPGQFAEWWKGEHEAPNAGWELTHAGDYAGVCRIYHGSTLLGSATFECNDVPANNRTYSTVNAAGGADYTSLDDGITWAKAADNRGLYVSAGTYTLAGAGQSSTNRNGIHIKGEPGVYVRAATSSSTAILGFVNCQRLVLEDLELQTANGTELNWGVGLDQQCNDWIIKNVRGGAPGNDLVSLFEWGSVAEGPMRRGIMDNVVGWASRYVWAPFTGTDIVVKVGEFNSVATPTGEGLVRLSGGFHRQHMIRRISFQGTKLDSGIYSHGLRSGASMVSLVDVRSETTGLSLTEGQSGDRTDNSGAHSRRMARCQVSRGVLNVLDQCAGTIKVSACVIPTVSGTLFGGHYHGKMEHCTFLLNESYADPGEANGLAVGEFSTATPALTQAALDHDCVNCLFIVGDPTLRNRTLTLRHSPNAGRPWRKINGNIFYKVSHANDDDNNFERRGTSTNIAGLNAWTENGNSIASGNIRHLGANKTRYPEANGYAYRKHSITVTVSSAVSATVFTVTGGSSEAHFHCGDIIDFGGGNTGQVKAYTSGGQITLVSALPGGTPSVSATATLTTDDDGMEAGLNADSSAYRDARRCFIDHSVTNIASGAAMPIPREDVTSISVTPGDGSMQIDVTYPGADTLAGFAIYHKSASEPKWTRVVIANSGDSVTGLTNGVEREFRAAARAPGGGESEWSDPVSGTPTHPGPPPIIPRGVFIGGLLLAGT